MTQLMRLQVTRLRALISVFKPLPTWRLALSVGSMFIRQLPVFLTLCIEPWLYAHNIFGEEDVISSSITAMLIRTLPLIPLTTSYFSGRDSGLGCRWAIHADF